MIRLAWIAVGIVAALAAPRAPSRAVGVESPTLDDLIRCADWIVLGHVTQVVDALPNAHAGEGDGPCYGNVGVIAGDMLGDSLRVARIQVIRSLKGSPPKSLAFLAQPTALCDTTWAEWGETAVYFLHGPEAAGERLSKVRAEARAALDAEWAGVIWAGRGRMVLESSEGGDLARAFDVTFPAVVGAVADESDQVAPLDRLEKAIAEAMRAQAETTLIRARSTQRGSGSFPWDLHVAGDRAARLVVHEPAGDRERTFTTSCRSLWTAEQPIVGLHGDRVLDVGRPDPRAGERSLQWLKDGRTLTIRLHPDALDPSAPPDESALALAALESWAAIRGSFDDPAAHDSRAADAKLREAAAPR